MSWHSLVALAIAVSSLLTEQSAKHMGVCQAKYSSQRGSQMLAKQIQVFRHIGKWARRLETDQIKQKSRALTKPASGNAIIAFARIVADAKAYDNQIEPLIMAISLCQDLSLDIMAFTIMKHLADATTRPLDSSGDIAPWLQNLSEFAA